MQIEFVIRMMLSFISMCMSEGSVITNLAQSIQAGIGSLTKSCGEKFCEQEGDFLKTFVSTHCCVTKVNECCYVLTTYGWLAVGFLILFGISFLMSCCCYCTKKVKNERRRKKGTNRSGDEKK